MERLATWPDNYVASWVFICLVAIALAWSRRHELIERDRGYLPFLLAPWKLSTFAVAGAGIALIAPHTGDIYWDYTVAAAMAIGSFLTAPWALAVLWRCTRTRAPASRRVHRCLRLAFRRELVVRRVELPALWSLPVTWAANIAASSFLYMLAGAVMQNRIRDGFYLLDEPEAAVSPQRQLVLMALIAERARHGAQFIVATHSPILMTIPDVGDSGACRQLASRSRC